MKSTKIQQKAIASRNHIAQVTKKLVSENGYDQVTISDIIQGSGVARATFYHYFKSKDELFNYIERTSYSEIHDKARVLEGNTPLEQLRNYIVFWFDLMDKDSVHFTRQWFHHASTAEYVRYYGEGNSKMDFDKATIREFLERARADGLLVPEAPVELLTNEILFSMQGSAFYRCMTDGQFDVAQWGQDFCGLVFEHILRDYYKKA